jgi:hypothetical protein
MKYLIASLFLFASPVMACDVMFFQMTEYGQMVLKAVCRDEVVGIQWFLDGKVVLGAEVIPVRGSDNIYYLTSFLQGTHSYTARGILPEGVPMVISQGAKRDE